MSQNMDLMMRVAASAQQESQGADGFDPEAWARERRWEWSTLSDWISAVQAAVDTGITEWGKNPAVITDGMILSYVQPAMGQM
jgi:hypothetical protein